jgi:hypothetical protein
VNNIKIEYPNNWTKVKMYNTVEFLPPSQNDPDKVHPKVSNKYTGFVASQPSSTSFKGHLANMITFRDDSLNAQGQQVFLDT